MACFWIILTFYFKALSKGLWLIASVMVLLLMPSAGKINQLCAIKGVSRKLVLVQESIK